MTLSSITKVSKLEDVFIFLNIIFRNINIIRLDIVVSYITFVMQEVKGFTYLLGKSSYHFYTVTKILLDHFFPNVLVESFTLIFYLFLEMGLLVFIAIGHVTQFLKFHAAALDILEGIELPLRKHICITIRGVRHNEASTFFVIIEARGL